MRMRNIKAIQRFISSLKQLFSVKGKASTQEDWLESLRKVTPLIRETFMNNSFTNTEQKAVKTFLASVEESIKKLPSFPYKRYALENFTKEKS